MIVSTYLLNIYLRKSVELMHSEVVYMSIHVVYNLIRDRRHKGYSASVDFYVKGVKKVFSL